MPTPEELAVLKSVSDRRAASAPPPAAEPTVKMVKDGQTVEVPESEHIDYLGQGYEDTRFAEGGEFNPTFAGGLAGVAERGLAFGEAVDRGALGGIGGLAGSVASAGVRQLAPAGGDLGVAAAPGLDAPLAPEATFGQDFAAAEADRRDRQEKLGVAGDIIGQGIGTIATLGAGTAAGLGAKALALSPVALFEKYGAKVATKMLGEEAVKASIAKTAAARATGALVENLGQGALSAATDNVDTALKDPIEAAKNIAFGTAVSGGVGAVLGGGLGLAEGAIRATGNALRPALDAAVAPKPLVPAVRDILPEQAVEANATRELFSAKLPDEKRTWAGTRLAETRAMGSEDNVKAEVGRALVRGIDEKEALAIEAHDALGIAQKRRVNEVALQQGFADNIAGVDPDDLVRQQVAQDRAGLAAQELAQYDSAVADATARRQAAVDAEAAARKALDNAEAGRIAPTVVAPAVNAADLGEIVPNAKFSRDMPDFRADTFDLGDSRIQVNSNELPGYASVAHIQVPPSKGRQGIGSKLYAKADEFARSKGLKLASDSLDKQTPESAGWWKKQVAAGRAELDPTVNRYVLNRPLTESFEKAAPAAAGKPKKLPKSEMRLYKEAFQAAREDLKKATKEFDRVSGDVGSRRAAADALAKEAASLPAARPMTRLEADSRDLFSGMSAAAREFLPTVAGPDRDVVENFMKRVAAHRTAVIDAYRAGDYGTAHNLIDQGLKGAVGDLVNGAKSSEVQDFAMNLYRAPQGFLENAQVWGDDIAGRNVLANRSWSDAIHAGKNSGYRSLHTNSGVAGRGGFGERQTGNSGPIAGFLNNIGKFEGETTEVGTRNALRADTLDYTNRQAAWGDESTAHIPAKMAKIQTHLEDAMDHAALESRLAAQGRQRIQNGALLATVGAAASGVGLATGNPILAAAGVPFISARWLLNTLGQYKGDVAQTIAKGVSGLLSGTGKAIAPVAKGGARLLAKQAGSAARERELSKPGNSRAETIARSNAILDQRSPEFVEAAIEAEKMNVLSPGLGDAALQHRLETAQYLVNKLPKPPSSAVFSPPPRLTSAAATSLDRTILAVNGPRKTFERIVTGAATAEDLDMCRTLYPQQYKQLTDTIMAEVQKNPQRVKSNSLRMYLSRVTGQPLTPALMRLADSQKRAQAATQGAEDAGAPEGQGANGSDGVTARAPIQFDGNPDALMARSDSIMAR
jgi:GNAT superfamily N-acetyltransferase